MRTLLSCILFLCITITYSQTEFITTWKTDNPGASASNRIVIPTYPGENYDYTINWGDGSFDSNVTESIVHTYDFAGTYQISISGQFPRIYFNNSGDKEKLILINQWGAINWTSMEKAFSGCINLDVVASDTPNLSDVNDLSYIFNGCSSLVGTNSFSNWDTSNITNMRAVFMDTDSFNQNIGGWDTSEVINMAELFKNSKAFNQDIGSWNTSKVTNLATTFHGATVFNQNIGIWDVSNVEVFLGTFAYTPNFNQDIGNWDVSSATDMAGMFSSALSFNQNIGNWDVSNVTRMINTFNFAISFNQNIGFWNVSNVTSMTSMFYNAQNFNQNLAYWNVSNVENMSSMFDRAGSFDQNLGNWNISKVTNLEYMFSNAGLSSYNYDATLNGWAQLPSLHSNLTFDAGNSRYCFSVISKNKLLNDYLWIINDSGKNTNCQPENFITTWKTDNPGISEENQITIPTYPGETYNYTVDWGDGTSNSNVTGDITHTYLSPGTYQVSISGEFPRIYFEGNLGNDSNGDFIVNDIDDNDKILSVNQWGDLKWNSMEAAFYGCSNLDVVAIDTPDLSNVQSMNEMFLFCTLLRGTPSFNNWDLNNVTSLASLFFQANKFNQDIGSWNTSNVTNMNGIFLMASSFNQNINGWDTSNVTNLGTAFHEATSFNQPLNNWDVSAVRQFNSCFGSSNFNQPLDNWNPISAYEMSNMFADNPVFNQNINSWNVSSVTNFGGMFGNATAFDQPLNDWNVSAAEFLGGMFFNATSFNQPLNNWDVSNVKEMVNMFAEASKFNQNITSWDTSSVTDIGGMFSGAEMFNQNLSIWNVAKVTDMNYMFAYASSFNQDLGGWNVSNVTNMELMFLDTGLSLENYDSTLIGWSNLSSLQNNVNFNASSSQYCESEQARQLIIDTYGWTIIDAGKVPFCNEDNDLDGILDHKDSCLDTRPNIIVNDNGCEIIAADAILVYGATPTCLGEANGSITISSALTDYIFNIAVEGPVSTDYNEITLNENIEVANLTTGLYMVTISIPDISYSQTYGIQINEVGSISGKRESLNTTAKTASYNVEGSYTYTVDVNGEMKKFNFTTNGKNEIQLTDLAEFNAISIAGESDCQGKVTDSFAFSDGVIMFPTITSGEVFIQGNEESSTVLVYDLSGKLILSKTLSEQVLNSIDLQVLETGIYPTVIKSKQHSKTFKIIKK